MGRIKGKKIGIDARFMLRPLRGIPLYVTRLCEHIPALARDCTFYLFINKGFEHNDTVENYLPRLERIQNENENVRIVNYDDDAEIMWEQVYLPRLVRKYKIDLLHMPANRICFFPGVPTIVTVHDVMEYSCLLDQKYPISWQKNKSLRNIIYNLRRRIYAITTYKYMFSAASHVITVSSNSAEDLKQHLLIPTGKIRVIHHGVDKEYFAMPPVALEDRTHTLMLGGDSYQKNPVAAIAAWAKVNIFIRKQHPLKIVGFCGSKSSPILSELNRFGLENEVEIKGWVSQKEMLESFQRAALFLFPSRYEGFGFPLIQAMASGTPVISSNRSSIPEVLGNVGFQLDADNLNGFAEGIEKVLTCHPIWHKQAEMGLSRAALFTWEKSANSHHELYLRSM